MRTFTVERGHDESGVSGIGIVMEGVEFSDQRLVIRWVTIPCSVVYWDCYPDFWRICIAGHPTNNTVVRWSDGQVDYQDPRQRGLQDDNGFQRTVYHSVYGIAS